VGAAGSGHNREGEYPEEDAGGRHDGRTERLEAVLDPEERRSPDHGDRGEEAPVDRAERFGTGAVRRGDESGTGDGRSLARGFATGCEV
jgi:hypothetical protein